MCNASKSTKLVKDLVIYLKCFPLILAELKPTSTDMDAIQFLKIHITPWEVVETKWRQTFKVRAQLILKRKKMRDIFSEFPLFSNLKLGFILVSYLELYLKLSLILHIFIDWIGFWNAIHKGGNTSKLDHQLGQIQPDHFETSIQKKQLGRVRCNLLRRWERWALYSIYSEHKLYEQYNLRNRTFTKIQIERTFFSPHSNLYIMTFLHIRESLVIERTRVRTADL